MTPISTLPVIPHWINGTAVSGGRLEEVVDPALGIATKQVELGGQIEVDAAVSAARAAFPAWRDLSISRRQAIMFRFRDLLAERSAELAALVTEEHGKVLSDAAGEVARGLEVVEFATGFPQLLKGDFSENVSTGIDVYSLKQPLGVVGIVTPFNFPAMVPLWFFPIALAAGNTVVLKPSEKVPSAAYWLAELLALAGLPSGVFNVLNGDKEAVDGLIQHPDVASISFVGSTPIARYVYEQASLTGKRVQALGGAKNHMLVLEDADLDLTADAAINAGFGSAGERCMAVSVLVVIDSVADLLIEKITARMDSLVVGDGRRACDMGPLISAEHRERVSSYIDTAITDGARVVVDGRGVTVDGEPGGYWLGPTLLDQLPTTSNVYKDEIFGPILSVVRVSDFTEGLDLINSSPYGNGTAIFTNNGGAARRFQREVEVGMIGINVPIPVPVAYHSFGGWKDSLFGGAKAYGADGFRFFTQEKAITSRWLNSSHAGINLGFPQNN